jgi:hypothetical protein
LRSSLLGPGVPLIDDLAPVQPKVLLTLLLLCFVVVVLAAAAGCHRYLEKQKSNNILNSDIRY